MNTQDQPDLFGAKPEPEYPDAPGWKRRDTSQAAAKANKKKAPTMRAVVLGIIEKAGRTGITPEEIKEKAAFVLRKEVDIMQIRPRVSELARDDKIEDTGTRRQDRGHGNARAIGSRKREGVDPLALKGLKEWTVGGETVARLYPGSCFDLFAFLADQEPEDRPKTLISDPPYPLTSGGLSKGAALNAGKFDPAVYKNDGKIVEGTDLAFSEWIPKAVEALQPDADLVIMSNDRNLGKLWNAVEDAGLRFHRLLVWARPTKTPNRWFMATAEFGLYGYAGKTRPVIHNKGAEQVTTSHGFRSETNHPTEKPVSLFAKWIGDITYPGELVIDPFSGTGAAALACIRKGRRFIGSEIDPRHFAEACDRIDNALSSGPLFEPPLASPLSL